MKTLLVENEFLTLRILPECGGKIASLRDAKTGKEWLWQNPRMRPRRPVYGESFVEGLDSGGWDEIIPSIAPCRLADGVLIPDHGDLVSSGWELVDSAKDRVVTEVRDAVDADETERVIQLDPDSAAFEMSYELSSHGEQDWPFLYATHPLLSLRRGTRLEFEGDPVLQVVVGLGSAEQCSIVRASELNEWIARESSAWAMKLFSFPGKIAWVDYCDPDSSKMRFEWSPRELPVLGLWINQRAWAGDGGLPYENLGIEPGTAEEIRLPRKSSVPGLRY